jgi:hypothetical protein
VSQGGIPEVLWIYQIHGTFKFMEPSISTHPVVLNAVRGERGQTRRVPVLPVVYHRTGHFVSGFSYRSSCFATTKFRLAFMHDDRNDSGWGADFVLFGAYSADRSTGATPMNIPGAHSIDALCFCLGVFKEVCPAS